MKLQRLDLPNVRNLWSKPMARVAVIAVFGLLGTVWLLSSQAVTPAVSSEAENGSAATGASAVTDSTASGGKAIVFRGGSTGGTSNLFLNGLFPIGVWVEPSSNFATWKARGVNTLVEVPNGSSLESWATAADQAGLYQIRDWRSNTTTDINDKYYLGPAQDDEPDGIFSQEPYSQIQANYNKWKAIDPNKPVFIDFVGSLNQFDISGACSDKVYRSSCASGDTWYAHYVAGADWLSGDTYPVNSGDAITNVGKEIDHLRALGGGTKPSFAFIETGDYDTTNSYPGPSVDQFRGELWSAIVHGARGIWYFPELVNPSFSYDVTPAAVVTEMTKQNATITALAPVLQGPINPGGIGATVTGSLQAGWRSTSAGDYFFVLNMSGSTLASQTITLTGESAASTAAVYGESRTVPITSGKITDSFAPYAIHIYQVAP